MSSIDVNLRDLHNFVSEVENLQNNIENGVSQVNSAVSQLEENVGMAVKNANEKIEEMIEDLNHAGEVIKHNQGVYEHLLRVQESQKRALASAESSLNGASAELSRVKNSSSGSTEEEKKAHNDAVKSAQKSVSSARENVTSANNALIQTNNKISKVIEAIKQLNLIVYDINRSRNTALEFIHSLTEKFNAVLDKKKSFEETCKRSLDSVKKYYSLGINAEKYVSKGLDHLHEVFDGYQSSQITMTSTRVISNLAELLMAMKRDAESFAKRHAKSSANFLEVMGDDVSVATVGLCREMSSNCVQCTKNFDDLANALLQAKKYFDSYVSLNEYR